MEMRCFSAVVPELHTREEHVGKPIRARIEAVANRLVDQLEAEGIHSPHEDVVVRLELVVLIPRPGGREREKALTGREHGKVEVAVALRHPGVVAIDDVPRRPGDQIDPAHRTTVLLDPESPATVVGEIGLTAVLGAAPRDSALLGVIEGEGRRACPAWRGSGWD